MFVLILMTEQVWSAAVIQSAEHWWLLRLGGNGAENTGVVQYICPCSVLILSYISCIALGGKSLHTYFF